MKIDHIGWITSNSTLFEAFWCDILGFKLVKSQPFPAWKVKMLFEVETNVQVKRYSHETLKPDIEIHVFPDALIPPTPDNFHRHGINHICLETGSRGSREPLIKKFRDNGVTLHTCNDPQGWINIFARDFEGNWIELREKFND